MESTFSILGILIFGLCINIYAILVESQKPYLVSVSYTGSPPPLFPPPPPLPSPPPPSSPSSTSPPPVSPPSPKISPPPPPVSPPSPMMSPPPPLVSPPPPITSHPPPPYAPRKGPSNVRSNNKPLNPSSSLSVVDVYLKQHPPTSHKMNAAQKIGLLFTGIAAIMQICVIAFLVFKRRQLLKTDRYELGT